MAAGSLDFTIEQGATFNLLLTWKIDAVPVVLTGYTARLQARVDTYDSEVILSMSTSSGITLGGVAGTIALNLNATQTAALQAGTFVYDLELQSNAGEVTRLVQGNLTISAEVTR